MPVPGCAGPVVFLTEDTLYRLPRKASWQASRDSDFPGAMVTVAVLALKSMVTPSTPFTLSSVSRTLLTQPTGHVMPSTLTMYCDVVASAPASSAAQVLDAIDSSSVTMTSSGRARVRCKCVMTVEPSTPRGRMHLGCGELRRRPS